MASDVAFSDSLQPAANTPAHDASHARTAIRGVLAWSPVLSQEQLILAATAFFTVFSNGPFWKAATALHPGNLLFVASLSGLLVAVNGLLLSLLVWRWTAKPVLSVLLVTTAMAVHYMTTYGVFMDADMVRNILHTDAKESRELLTPSLVSPLLVFALLPIALLWRVRIAPRSITRTVWVRPLFMLGLIALALGSTLLSSAEVAAMVRNHREIKYLASPMNYLIGLKQNLTSSPPINRTPKTPIATDAAAVARPAGSRPRLLVLVVGETVRAQNWGLNGYARQTTPELAQIGVINFPDMHSCGTSTEVSLPCMFSPLGRRNYDEKQIHRQQSLLNVLDKVGITTLWRDNQSGCKGVCDGTRFESLSDASDAGLCAHGRCMDEILLKQLGERVRSQPGDRVVVLHQLGNHGPSYFERYPDAFRKFSPPCENPDLGDCQRTGIVNAYDNAVLYTDHFLARTIHELQAMEDYDTGLIYVSDHGESLGEKGLYLHGVPYAIAPAEQTHVPMVMWFSSRFTADRGLDTNCLRHQAMQKTTHDALFSSILGLMQVTTTARDPGMDLFAACTSPATQA